MLSQIGSLKEKYSEWVNKPVDRPLRLFGPTWLENLTKTPWWLVPLFWLPSIAYITSIGLNEANAGGFSSVSACLLYYLTTFTNEMLYNVSESCISKFYRWHCTMDNIGVLIASMGFSFEC